MGPETRCISKANGGGRGGKGVQEGRNGGPNGCGEGYDWELTKVETVKAT